MIAAIFFACIGLSALYGQGPAAVSALQDSGTQSGQPGAAKGSSVTGCLSGPDGDDIYTLRSMQHRTGVQVVGPDDLKDASGGKVKLTGSWESIPTPYKPRYKGEELRRFKAKEVEVLSQSCEPPSPTSPPKQKKQ